MNKKFKTILISTFVIGMFFASPIAGINANAATATKGHPAVPQTGKLKWVKEDGSFTTNEWVYKERILKNGTIESGWMYFGADGVAKNGWFDVNGKLYYAKEKLDSDKKREDDTYYIFMNTWAPDENNCLVHHVDENGAMQTGCWIKETDGFWYYLDSSGKMIKNTVVQGSKIDMLGHWIKPVTY